MMSQVNVLILLTGCHKSWVLETEPEVQVLYENNPTSIYCISGNNDDILWLKNGFPLKKNPLIKRTSDILIFKNATVQDSGRYQCLLHKNEASYYSSLTTFSILKVASEYILFFIFSPLRLCLKI